MNTLSINLVFAKVNFFLYKIFLFIKLGSKQAKAYLHDHALTMLDFLPEVAYSTGEFRAVPRKHTDDFYLLFLPREEELKTHLKLNENETFVDVGANVGAYSLRLGSIYEKTGAKVIAIEAHPGNYLALQRNIQANQLQNIEAINIAVSDHSGTVELHEHVIMNKERDDKNRVQTGHFSLSKEFMGNYSVKVNCDTLDNILKDRRVDLLKIDVEGAEVIALRGAHKTLGRARRIIVEIHQDNLETVREILGNHAFHLSEVEGVDGMKYLIGFRGGSD